jgi:hypothetical protein
MACGGRPAAEVITALTARYPEVPRERIRADFEELLGDLGARGLISVETNADVDHAWNETSMAVEARPPGRIGARFLAAAALALPIATVLAHLPFRWTAKLIRTVKRRLPYPEATVEEAEALARAVQRVGRHYSGRVACYEQSLIVLVAAALSGRSVTLHLGTATDPRRFHAWIETSGRIVKVYPDPRPGDEYHRVLVL